MFDPLKYFKLAQLYIIGFQLIKRFNSKWITVAFIYTLENRTCGTFSQNIFGTPHTVRRSPQERHADLQESNNVHSRKQLKSKIALTITTHISPDW